jgi:hypothetical protein
MKAPCTYEGMENDPTCEIEEEKKAIGPFTKGIIIFNIGFVSGIVATIGFLIWLVAVLNETPM